MFVLTRREKEGIVINTADGDIEITIVQTKKSQVRIGFKCDPKITIRRREKTK